MLHRLTIVVATTAAALAACRSAPEAPTLNFGSETCAECGQTVTEPTFAGFVRTADRSLAFDDPGCLIRHIAASAISAKSALLHEHGGDAWIPTASAWLARARGITTPRGYGWTAHADFAAAQELVTRAGDGEIATFEQVRQRLAP